MCSIFGVVTGVPSYAAQSRALVSEIQTAIRAVASNSKLRGRDGIGWVRNSGGVFIGARLLGSDWAFPLFMLPGLGFHSPTALIGNSRAEPTTEWVKEKQHTDQQPYSVGNWSIVHNGTIANDAQSRTYKHPTKIDSAAIVELLDSTDFGYDSLSDAFDIFRDVVKMLVGSYAILAVHTDFPGYVFAACNYRPIWYATRHDGAATFFASDREMFPEEAGVPVMCKPYTATLFHGAGALAVEPLLEPAGTKALVVCSGGLDSVTAAAWAKHQGMNVTLIHFMYGCRAQAHEMDCVQQVARALDVPLQYFPMNIYDKEDSPLLSKDVTVAGGEQGAEFAFEWVPARNLVMLSLATAYAEAKGYDYIILGNNLEEAGAYPDNEPEFYSRFNDLLPFAVRDGKRLEVLQPVGNLMKHEIVKLAHEVGAPLHLTWSCYKHGDKHCGQCGPCYMRKTAFAINELPEVIEYEA